VSALAQPLLLARPLATARPFATARPSQLLTLFLLSLPPPLVDRYYGESLPFGDASYELQNLGLLSNEQALADYAILLQSLKANLSCGDGCPVVTYGGSYGGMLAAWFRMRYPHITVGAIASSAPILQIPGIMDPHDYNKIITQDFADYNPVAPQAIYNTWGAMLQLGQTQTGRDQLQQLMRICDPLNDMDDVWNVLYYINSAIGFAAMASEYRGAVLGSEASTFILT
jgi:pimeloyl-ACP methyl ester carboxylesterase